MPGLHGVEIYQRAVVITKSRRPSESDKYTFADWFPSSVAQTPSAPRQPVESGLVDANVLPRKPTRPERAGCRSKLNSARRQQSYDRRMKRSITCLREQIAYVLFDGRQ